MKTVPLEIENWEPIALDELRYLLNPVGSPWWVAGGVALDLFLKHSTRRHRDVDVMVLRVDQLSFQRRLVGWELMIPTGSWEGEPGKSRHMFRAWEPGEWLERGVDQTWCRRSSDGPWSFELLFAEGDAEAWRFKRDLEITRPLSKIGDVTADGIPFLMPEIVLLHKATSSSPGENADFDFEAILPSLDSPQLDWLRENLTRVKPEHSWLERLS